MSLETLERLVDTYLFYPIPTASSPFRGEPTLAGLPFFTKLVESRSSMAATGTS